MDWADKFSVTCEICGEEIDSYYNSSSAHLPFGYAGIVCFKCKERIKEVIPSAR